MCIDIAEIYTLQYYHHRTRAWSQFFAKWLLVKYNIYLVYIILYSSWFLDFLCAFIEKKHKYAHAKMLAISRATTDVAIKQVPKRESCLRGKRKMRATAQKQCGFHIPKSFLVWNERIMIFLSFRSILGLAVVLSPHSHIYLEQ